MNIDASINQAAAQITSVNKAEPVAYRAKKSGGFAGFSWRQIIAGAVLIIAVLWSVWISKQVMALEGRRVVAVNLAAMANDFVSAQARSGGSPEQVEADTRHYLAGLEMVLRKRAALGETLIVGEAVVSGSAPDITPQVRAEVGQYILDNPPPRLSASVNVGQISPGSAQMQPRAVVPPLETGVGTREPAYLEARGGVYAR
jgi:hypothetical protein